MDQADVLKQLQALYEQRNSLHGNEEGQRWLARVAAMVDHVDPSRAEAIRQRAQIFTLPLSSATIGPTWNQVLQTIEDVIAKLESGVYPPSNLPSELQRAGDVRVPPQASDSIDVEKLSLGHLFRGLARLSVGSAIVLLTGLVAMLGAAYRLGTLRATGKAPSAQTVGEANPLKCAEYRVLITSPNSAPPFEVAGVSGPPPDGFELWLFTKSGPCSSEVYWPKERAQVVGGKWRISLSPADFTAGQPKRFALFMVGKNGQQVIDYYKLAGASAWKDKEWPALTRITTDMIRCVSDHEVTMASGDQGKQPGNPSRP